MIVALDLETTGLNPREDKIIEIALIKIDIHTRKIIEIYNTFINPNIPIPGIVSEITNIFDSDVEQAPDITSVIDEVNDFIWDSPILWHNTKFDRDFLLAQWVDIERNLVLDTFFLANFLLYDIKSLNLGFICSHVWINIQSEHRAIDDTKATVELFDYLIKKLSNISYEQQKILKYFVKYINNPEFRFYLEHYFPAIESYTEDELIDYILSTISTSKKPFKIEQKYDISEQKIDNIFWKNDDFEIRENQKKMIDIVNNTFSQNKKIVLEAPTWVWKTFWYLIPSIYFSVRFWEQVFVSTTTKVLQDQIFLKDLQYLQENIDFDFSFTKLKGKRNYVSLFWLFSFFESIDRSETNILSFILKIVFWLLDTKYGELDELDYYGEEYSFLQEINAENPLTFETKNPYLKQEFSVIARDRAKNSNIVVVNNSLLFQDIASDRGILGDIKNLVLDEAHNIEDVVTQSIKKSFSLIWLKNVFESYNKKLKKHDIELSPIILLQEKILFQIGMIQEIFGLYLSDKVPQNSKYRTTLVKKEFFEKFPEARNVYDKFLLVFLDFTKCSTSFSEEILSSIAWEKIYIENVKDILDTFFSQESLFNTIIPIISDRGEHGFYFEYTLLNPGVFLQKNLWSKLDSLVLTSATLKVEGSYDYITHMLSLQNFDFFTLETDFDYEKQALLFIPNDLGSIKNNNPNIINFLRDFLVTVKWKTLILLTSFSNIQEYFLSLNQDLKKQNITLLAQSISWGKQKHIDYFTSHAENSVLMWTDSFWEGVDIKWDNLKYIIIHKIPFMVPSDPVFQARSILFQDSFSEYSIPKSILKLKQWFGRLIRTKKDSGVVIFLDDRIFTTRWGERFFNAFPNGIRIKKSSSESLIHILKK